MSFSEPSLILSVGLIIISILLLALYKLNKTSINECPSCGCDHCDRIKRPFLIKLFFFFISNLKYYRCPGCGKKFIIVANKNAVVNKNLKYLKV